MEDRIAYKPFGEKAILIEWEPRISNEILKDILTFKHKIEQHSNNKYVDIIVGYNSLTIKYKYYYLSFSDEVLQFKNIYKSQLNIEKQANYLWTIPVCYDLQFGIDLKEISNTLQLQVKELIELHSRATYSVFFIGFLPGFLYLGGLDKNLFMDRKPIPRLQVSKGSVAIGGKQTGVYPIDSPGGWNIIGRTPISFFDINKENPCFVKSGDTIKFKPISLTKYYNIEQEVAKNSYQLSKTLCDD